MRPSFYSFFIVLLILNSSLLAQDPKIPAVYGDRAKIGCVKYYSIKFNPILEQCECERNINRLIFGDGLFTHDQDGDVINGLAQAGDQENSLIWRIRLRTDIKFHDRSALTAYDVKFSFELYKKFASQVPKLFQFRLIKAIEILDQFNLRIILSQPLENFEESIGQIPVLPQKWYKQWNDSRFATGLPSVIPAIGTGYFIHRRETANAGIRLDVNKDHYRGRANLDGIDYIFFETYDQMVDAYLQERIDVVQIQSKKVRQKIYQIVGPFTYLTIPRDELKLYYVNINTRTLPFNDKNIRKALNNAINKVFIVDRYLENNAQVASTVLNERSEYFLKKFEPDKYNPLLSLEFLRIAGYKQDIGKLVKNGREFTFDIYFEEGSEFEESLVRLISINLLELGMNVIPIPLKPQEIKQRIAKGEFQAALQHFVYHPKNSVEALKEFYFHKLNNPQGFTNYRNRLIDLRFKTSNDPIDESQVIQIMYQVQTRIYRDVPSIFLFLEEKVFYAIDSRFSQVKNSVYEGSKKIHKMHPIYEWYVPKDKQKY